MPARSDQTLVKDSSITDDGFWMRRALALAGQSKTEVPIGALMVRDGQCIAQGWNRPIGTNDPTAHAEIITLREAGRHDHNYRFRGATLYVTLEPCVMCAGAIIHARLRRVVFGAWDPKAGAAGSVFDILGSSRLHRVEVIGGVLSEECGEKLRAFFEQRRC